MHTRRLPQCFLALAVILLTLAPLTTGAARSAAGTWALTDSLHQARGFQTATLLVSGQVLVAGGCHDPCSYTHPDLNLASAEVYHPNTGRWERTGSMHEPRIFHTATLLPDGRVLVAGGCRTSTCTNVFASAELYDPRSSMWSVTGSMHEPRDAQTATLLPTGQVLVAGGVSAGTCGKGPTCSTLLASAELYNPRTGAWTLTHPMRAARDRHTATLLATGQVLVAGGFGVTIKPLASAELYDPRTGAWTLTGSLHQARSVQAATLLNNGQVLVTGGFSSKGLVASTELYHPRTGLWTLTGSLHDPRYYEAEPVATLLGSGQVLVAGNTGANRSALASAELYDPRTGGWTLTGSLHQARFAQTTTLLSNGQVLVVGGCHDGPRTGSAPPLASAEIYHP